MYRYRALGWLAGALLASTGIAAADTPPYLFNDINKTQVITASSCPESFSALGDHVYFAADDGVAGKRLWRSDGTEVGTEKFGPDELAGEGFRLWPRLVLGKLFFLGSSDGGEYEMWVTDGTAPGTRHLAAMDDAMESGNLPYEAGYLASIGNNFVYAAEGRIWKLSEDMETSELLFHGSESSSYAKAGNLLCFFNQDAEHGIELWTCDGTVEGTAIVKDIVPGGDPGVAWYVDVKSMGAIVLFQGDDRGLWRSDGTEPGTYRLMENTSGSDYQWLSGDDAQQYFALGGDIWITNGEIDGTRVIIPWGATDNSFVSAPGEIGPSGLFLCVLENGEGGTELWRSDGKLEGTFQIALWSGYRVTTDWGPEISGVRYFLNGDYPDTILGSTDGTMDGTVSIMVIPSADGFSSCYQSRITYRSALPNGRFLLSPLNTVGNELWVSDGTLGGTELIRNIRAETTTSSPKILAATGGALYLDATTDGDHRFLSSDGQPSGTLTQLAEAAPSRFVELAGRLIYSDFLVSDPYRTDGTVAGTVPLCPQLWQETGDPAAERRFSVFMGFRGDSVLFAAYVRGGALIPKQELWQTDGTDAGTGVLAQFDSQAQQLRTWETKAHFREVSFFSARAAGESPLGLWKSDGTMEGTIPVPAPQVIDPQIFSPCQKHTFFTAELPGIRYIYGFWRSDGTEEGTVYLNPIVPTTSVVELAGQGYFKAVDAGAKAEQLWRSNGTPEGTLPIKSFTPGPGGVAPLRNDRDPIVVAGRLAFFAANDGVVGRELWVLDTRAGEEIRLVADIRPGADGSNLHNIVARGERIFFTANDGVHGVELWQSDGSPEGTTMMGDIYPGTLPSSPESLTVFGNRLIFSATDGSATGRELWAVDLDILPQTGWILDGGFR